MSISHPQPEPTASDELVAYLDGELPPEDCRRVENRLAADADYRQQLRDLDQAWEALNTLPKTAVDDNFARTTIELACVDAEKDFSHRTAQTSAETRSRAWRWIAGGIAAAVFGFALTRALVAHRNNALLADLPVIQQFNALTHVENIEFLQELAKRVPTDQLVKDEVAFDRDLTEYKRASSTPEARREWVNSLSAEEKAELADQAGAFDRLRQTPREKEQLRKLAANINGADDAPQLQKTLVAYGRWLAWLDPADKEQLRNDLRDRSPREQVAAIEILVRRENEQAARHLSPADAKALHAEIMKFAEEKKGPIMAKLQRGRDGNRPRNATLDGSPVRQAVWILHAALQDDDMFEPTSQRLVNQLSPEQREHWDRLGRWRREIRRGQLAVWIRDSMQPKWGPDDLEKFFAGDKLTDQDRARLLELPRPEMEARLEQLYLSAELGIDDRALWPREFGDPGRMPIKGPGPPSGNPGPAAFGPGRPDKRMGPDGRPLPDRFERDRDGRDRENRRDEDRPIKRQRPPGDRPPPNGPPPLPDQPRDAI